MVQTLKCQTSLTFFSKKCHPTRLIRPVVPECAGCAMAHPDFGRSVNPILTRGDRLCPPNYYWHTRIFRPSDSPVQPRFLEFSVPMKKHWVNPDCQNSEPIGFFTYSLFLGTVLDLINCTIHLTQYTCLECTLEYLIPQHFNIISVTYILKTYKRGE